jgi:ubiquinone/menaquinone biosynthesis C-methylase UbiE
MAANSSVPAYEPMLAAYHQAFAPELRSMIATLPILAGQSVLDMACGDGVYSPWLAERVGPNGRVVAVDLESNYLEIARAEAEKSALSQRIEFIVAPIDALPFDDGTFDLVWCAQSLYSLPEPVAALKHMQRVTKPGGVVAVLEGDTVHHLILPWPIEVELSVRAAELEALANQSDWPRKFYVGRCLRRVFREAGLTEIEANTFATDRHAPLGPDERIYFEEYVKGLTHRVDRYFQGSIRKEYDRLTDPDSEVYLLDDPDLSATCIDHVVWGRKPNNL